MNDLYNILLNQPDSVSVLWDYCLENSYALGEYPQTTWMTKSAPAPWLTQRNKVSYSGGSVFNAANVVGRYWSRVRSYGTYMTNTRSAGAGMAKVRWSKSGNFDSDYVF